MKKILIATLVGILVLSGLGASAIKTNTLKTAFENDFLENTASASSPKAYTHTVLVEVGTATWCPSCPASNAAWHTLYAGGNYDFEYIELVDDKNPDAHQRFYEFNPAWVPTSYWDGGMFVYPGTNQATFIANLNSAGARVVPDLVATLEVTWLGSAQMQITYEVQNNEATNYPGKLRIYVQELESRWNDYSGNPYHHALIDMAKKIDIDIPAAGSISDSFTWDGTVAGYPDVTQDNLQIILAVFDDQAHTAYSDPPSGNPFNAYYSDECIATTPEGQPQNNPPGAPTIDGPTNGKVGVDYDFTFMAIDPDGDDIFYIISWGCCANETHTYGPYPSGEAVVINHTWAEQGTFTITAKAKDVYELEGPESTLEITIPRNRAINGPLMQFLKSHTNLFQIIKMFLQRVRL